MDMKFPRYRPASLSWSSQMAAFFNDTDPLPHKRGRFAGMGPCMHSSPPLLILIADGQLLCENAEQAETQKHGYSREAPDEAASIRIGRRMFIEGADILL
jgi:hypothetical protein